MDLKKTDIRKLWHNRRSLIPPGPWKKAVRITGWIFCSLLGLCTIAAGYSGLIDPNITAIPAILALTFPLWILLTLLALAVTLCFSRWMALVPAATLVFCLGPILSNMPLNLVDEKITPKDQDRIFKLLSYNSMALLSARHPGDATNSFDPDFPYNPTLSFIINSGADVVCLAEYPRHLTPQKMIRVTPEQCDSMDRIYPHKVANDYETIYSKYPLYPVEPNYPPHDPYPAFLPAVVDIMGRKTLVVAVHLASFELDDNDRMAYREFIKGQADVTSTKQRLLPKLSLAFTRRAAQADSIRSLIDRLGINNVIVTGDFNDVPGCYAIRRLCRDDMRSSFDVAGRGMINTFHANHFYFHIDHTLYRGGMEAVRFSRPLFDNSDHYPIETIFKWVPANRGDMHGVPSINLIPDSLRKEI